jgi:hypothetical protein
MNLEKFRNPLIKNFESKMYSSFFSLASSNDSKAAVILEVLFKRDEAIKFLSDFILREDHELTGLETTLLKILRLGDASILRRLARSLFLAFFNPSAPFEPSLSDNVASKIGVFMTYCIEKINSMDLQFRIDVLFLFMKLRNPYQMVEIISDPEFLGKLKTTQHLGEVLRMLPLLDFILNFDAASSASSQSLLSFIFRVIKNFPEAENNYLIYNFLFNCGFKFRSSEIFAEAANFTAEEDEVLMCKFLACALATDPINSADETQNFPEAMTQVLDYYDFERTVLLNVKPVSEDAPLSFLEILLKKTLTKRDYFNSKIKEDLLNAIIRKTASDHLKFTYQKLLLESCFVQSTHERRLSVLQSMEPKTKSDKVWLGYYAWITGNEAWIAAETQAASSLWSLAISCLSVKETKSLKKFISTNI